MTPKQQNTAITAALVIVAGVFIFLYVRGRKVFNRALAADVIDKYVGRPIIDRKNENQDTYLFAWWYAISRNAATFTHNGNVFSTKTGTFIPAS